MRIYHKLKNHYHCPIINLDKLWTLLGDEVRTATGAGLAPLNNACQRRRPPPGDTPAAWPGEEHAPQQAGVLLRWRRLLLAMLEVLAAPGS
jgi:hypothetical protein